MQPSENKPGTRCRKLSGFAVLGLVLFISACLPGAVEENDRLEPLTTSTGMTPGANTQIANMSINTPTSAPESGCAIPPGSPPNPNLEASFEWAPEIQAYLNDGGLVEPLAETLASTPAPDGSAAKVFHQDLTGDGLEDVAITLYQSDQQTGQVSGSLLIFRCDQDRYRLAFSTTPLQNFDPPVLKAVQDLNADGIAEILITHQTCGAHTCFIQVELLRWDRSGFINIFEGRADDLPSPDLEIAGPTSDGRYRIEIIAGGIASAGAGPYRQMTRVWQWSPDQSRYLPVEERLAPPAFRIHLLHDADDAAAAGNVDAALIMYQRVREDGSLNDWVKGDEGHAQLASFAIYRQMTLYMLQDRHDLAREALQFLQESNPEGSPGYGMRLLAEAYWEAYQESTDLEAACTSAQRFGQLRPAEVLEPLQYGYANRTYTARDLCPSTS